jgi:RNase P subunit RPR2
MMDKSDNCKVCKKRIFEWQDFAVYVSKSDESVVRVHCECEWKMKSDMYDMKKRVEA